MIKYAYKIIFTILIIALLINVVIFFTWTTSATDEVYVIKPQLDNMKVTTKLYFVFEDDLRSETRTITVKNNEFEKSIFEELIIGPKTKAYGNILPEDVKVISFDLNDNVIYINLESEFLSSDMFNEENFSLQIMAFVNTLTELKHFLQIQFLFDGERVTQDIYGLSLMESFNRDERVIYKKDETSSDFVISFIEMIFNHRFDLAYENLNEKSKKSYPYEVFQELMEGYIYYHSGYQRNIYFMQNYDVHDIVTVKFVEINPEEVNLGEITEQWKVDKIDDSFKIDITELIQP